MNILYEDKDIIICSKEVGLLSEISPEKPSLANEIQNTFGYAGVIHRLDTNVGGAILYAKNKRSAALFSSLVSGGELCKEYLAVVHGAPESEEGVFKDFLFKDSSKNKVYPVKRMRKGVKEAELSYKLIEKRCIDGKIISLVKIKLHTGRSHQIRVQFSSRRMPLVGDGKYGSKDNKCNVSLWSHKLSFINPINKKLLSVTSFPDNDAYPWNLFEFILI